MIVQIWMKTRERRQQQECDVEQQYRWVYILMLCN